MQSSYFYIIQCFSSKQMHLKVTGRKYTKQLRISYVAQGLFFGFLANILYQQSISFWSVHTAFSAERIIQKCPPCNIPECPHCQPTKIELHDNETIKNFYKPQGMYEVTRWLYFDEKHIYDIINEEPKVKSNGYWKEEVKVTTQVGLDYVNKNKMLGQSWTLAKFQAGYTKTDSIRGTDFLLDLHAKSGKRTLPNPIKTNLFRIHMVHPLEQIRNSIFKSVKKITKEKITIITPLPQVSIILVPAVPYERVNIWRRDT